VGIARRHHFSSVRAKRPRDEEDETYGPAPPPPPPRAQPLKSLASVACCVKPQKSEAPSEVRLFRCNLCHMSFLEEGFLQTHVRTRHGGNGINGLLRLSGRRGKGALTLLRPRYACGACPARFFKLAFLIKHVEERHRVQKIAANEYE